MYISNKLIAESKPRYHNANFRGTANNTNVINQSYEFNKKGSITGNMHFHSKSISVQDSYNNKGILKTPLIHKDSYITKKRIIKTSTKTNNYYNDYITKTIKQQLPRIKVSKYSYHSKKGVSLNTNKVNQDSFFTCLKINGNPNQHLFGVADGHGQFGKEISNLIKDYLPSNLHIYISFLPGEYK